MRRLKAIVTVMVLAVWSACTVHCTIENLTAGSTVPCCNDEGGQSGQAPGGPGQCVCSAIQAGGYVTHDKVVSAPVPLLTLSLFVIRCDLGELLAAPGIVEAALSPPEIAPPWQFCFRTALPARAPSLIA